MALTSLNFIEKRGKIGKHREKLGEDERKIEIKSIDDNPDNNEIPKEVIDKKASIYAKEILKNEEIAEVYNHADVEKRIKKTLENNGKAYLTAEQLKAIEDSLEKDAQLEHQPRGIA